MYIPEAPTIPLNERRRSAEQPTEEFVSRFGTTINLMTFSMNESLFAFRQHKWKRKEKGKESSYTHAQ